MPRINIEDEFFVDVGMVAARIGDYDKATGLALRWIKFGQEKFRAGRPVSVAEFKERFSEALIPEFARIDGDSVIVVGAQKHFSWLMDKKESGRLGGRSKSEAKTKHLFQNSKNGQKPKHTEASPSYSPSPSKKLINSSFKAGAENVDNPAALCLLAVQRFGPDEREAIREFVGEQLYEHVRSTCGWQSIREMKRDNFTMINLARNLGDASGFK